MTEWSIQDRAGKLLTVGTRVRILCHEDLRFYRRIGVVTLIDQKRDHSVFVQMVTSKGGIWWFANYLKALPKFKSRKRISKQTKGNKV